MKRIASVVLAVLLLATVGATAAVAQPAGNAAVRQFDVTSGPVSGKLTIDTAAQTFVFNGKGGTPGTTYYLYTSLATAPLGSGVADSNGNLHIEGTCTATTAQLDTGTVTVTVNAAGGVGDYPGIAALGLVVEMGGWFVAKIACYYSTDGGVTWKESGHSSGIAMGTSKVAMLSDLGVPKGALVKMHAIVVAGKDRTGSEVFRYDEYSSWYANYWIKGTTLNPTLTYHGFARIQ